MYNICCLNILIFFKLIKKDNNDKKMRIDKIEIKKIGINKNRKNLKLKKLVLKKRKKKIYNSAKSSLDKRLAFASFNAFTPSS